MKTKQHNMLEQEMRNYKTNFAEVDKILFEPKRGKKTIFFRTAVAFYHVL